MQNEIIQFVYSRLESAFSVIVLAFFSAIFTYSLWNHRRINKIESDCAERKRLIDNQELIILEIKDTIVKIEKNSGEMSSIIETLTEILSKQDKRIENIEASIAVIQQQMVGWDVIKRMEMFLSSVSPEKAGELLGQALSLEVKNKDLEMKRIHDEARLKEIYNANNHHK